MSGPYFFGFSFFSSPSKRKEEKNEEERRNLKAFVLVAHQSEVFKLKGVKLLIGLWKLWYILNQTGPKTFLNKPHKKEKEKKKGEKGGGQWAMK